MCDLKAFDMYNLNLAICQDNYIEREEDNKEKSFQSYE